MITKYLISTSIFSLISISVLQAADIVVSEQPVPVITVPSFSWTGFYLGGQIGNFSGKTTANYLTKETGIWNPVEKEYLPKLSGFMGGVYAGSNIDIDNGFIIGIDTDVMWSNKKSTKDILLPKKDETGEKKSLEKTSHTRDSHEDASTTLVEGVSHTLKQKWSGATRVKVGFAFERMMPYVSGGIAYTQLQNILSAVVDSATVADSESRAIDSSDWLHDEKKTMIGYTLGGGVDFAMTDNVIVRAEYRYSDFGKKKFVQDKVEMSYKTNDFRVGVAYKF
ncbi:outer membrane protein [Bartonella tribocorum]|uniref:Hemin binding protein D n=1 Tax=Bartonella tribocorum (strain DSM 28219 / CCUG 45778 / CIP 105476 / IBS 506) TaxID=382640 RepID=A9IR39_BART1|nr:outer membrane protein [Bartonella tribocorum]CAK01134.1 hemin binding protein D [Bartonella tribocorum CIP 105476]CDO48351.1 hemin binding protein D [Bartonella tribocorum]